MKQSFTRKPIGLKTSILAALSGFHLLFVINGGNNVINSIPSTSQKKGCAAAMNGGPPTFKRNRRYQIKHGFKAARH